MAPPSGKGDAKLLLEIIGVLVQQFCRASDIEQKTGAALPEIAKPVVDRKRIGAGRVEPVGRLVHQAGMRKEVGHAVVGRPIQDEFVEWPAGVADRPYGTLRISACTVSFKTPLSALLKP